MRLSLFAREITLILFEFKLINQYLFYEENHFIFNVFVPHSRCNGAGTAINKH